MWWLESCAIYGATANQNLTSTKMQFFHDYRRTLESEMKRLKGARENSKRNVRMQCTYIYRLLNYMYYNRLSVIMVIYRIILDLQYSLRGPDLYKHTTHVLRSESNPPFTVIHWYYSCVHKLRCCDEC